MVGGVVAVVGWVRLRVGGGGRGDGVGDVRVRWVGIMAKSKRYVVRSMLWYYGK